MTIDKQTQKGFTLIELMIVVAIIGILASIAIPQFSTFRIKAYNSAALSDIHGARLAEEALYTDYQTYGGSDTAATGTTATTTGVLLPTGTAGDGTFISTATASTGMPITVSNAVKLVARASADADPGNATPVYADAATVSAKHTEGDKLYTAETDQTGLFQKPATAGTAMVLTDAVAASTGVALDSTVANGFIKMK